MLLNRSWGDCRGGEKGEEEQQQSIGNGKGGGKGHLMAVQDRRGEGCWQLLKAVDFELLFLCQVNLQRENRSVRIVYYCKSVMLHTSLN